MDIEESLVEAEFLFYSVLYSTITVIFAMAVLSKFFTNEFRFGFRSFLSLVVLFIGEPMCHFLLKGATGVTIFGLGCLFIYSILPASHLPSQNKTVLITGCDSGFGHALAKKLDSIGMRVFAGCLVSEGVGAIELRHSCSDSLKIVQLDVTKQEEVDAAYVTISEALGSEGLWGVVNNAGVWYVAELEMMPTAMVAKILDINVMGMVRVTSQFLPLIRKAKGRIINMSSIAGKVAMEFFGAYSMSKHSIEAYSDALRQEMFKWGVKVSIIQPSGFATGATKDYTIRDRRAEVWREAKDSVKEEYGKEYYNEMIDNFANLTPKFPTDLSPVVRAMRSGLLSKRPRERYPCGRGAETLLTVYPILPIWVADRFCRVLGIRQPMIPPNALK